MSISPSRLLGLVAATAAIYVAAHGTQIVSHPPGPGSPYWVGADSTSAPQSCVQDTEWQLGNAFRQRAASNTFDVHWDQGELRTEVQFLAKTYGLSLVIDRRVDPNRMISLSAKGQTFEQILWRLAEPESCAAVQLPNTFYLGPAEVALTLPQRLDELKKQIDAAPIAPSIKRRLADERPLKSAGPIVVPSELFEQLATDCGVTGIDLHLMPHDVWPQIDWPQMPVYQQMGLILTGFELWLEIDSQGNLSVAPYQIPDTATIHYEFMREPSDLQRQLRSKVRGLQTEVARQRFSMRGSVGQLSTAARLIADWMQPRSGSEDHSTFSLKTRGSRLSILTAIAQQTGRQIQVEEPLQAALREVIEFDAVELTLEQLIAKALDGLDASFILTPSELTIRPKR